MAARVPAPVRKLVDRASLVVALLTGLVALWVVGQPVVPVITFLSGAVLAYGSFQYAVARVLSKKKLKGRRRPASRRS
ncbi:hypothetical protein HYE82_08690 [Streptomyces sp. BR123]|uniref:hypothetical protein n=1 Tax=Streptomyces sp. BR123 TaxID=2749828 RepID=UPI0015C4DA11|nr:hypothetical protein [Streptomyces sp. BR123]NXY94467.1 hypothetical protein [Streptomyces sp. BR123]